VAGISIVPGLSESKVPTGLEYSKYRVPQCEIRYRSNSPLVVKEISGHQNLWA